MAFSAPATSLSALSRPLLWAGVVLATALLAGVGYVVLPMFGVTVLASLLSFKTLMAACLLLIGGAFYWAYLDGVRARPWVLLTGFVIFYPLFIYLASVMASMGMDIRARILMLGLFCGPSVMVGWRLLPDLWRQYPHIAGWMTFVAIFLVYYFFYNVNMMDPRTPGVGGHVGEGLMAFEKMYVTVTLAASALLTGAVFLKLPDRERFFARFNRILLVLLSVYSIITLLGYPFGVYTAMIDGFKRSLFIFTHPNHYAHYLGFMLVYVCGLWLHYRKQPRPLLPVALILSGLFLTLPAFLLAMSKTAMALTGLCLGVMLIANQLGDRHNRMNPLFLVTPAILCVLAVGVLQALGIVDFVGTLTARLEDQESLLWRFATWQRIFSDIELSSLLLGNGLTATNARIVQLTMNYHDVAKGIIASPFAHNAYVETLYDFGLIGFTWLAGLLALIVSAMRRFARAAATSDRKPLYLIAICLTLYFLGVCNFDEMFYAIPFPFWYITTLVWGMTLQPKAPPDALV